MDIVALLRRFRRTAAMRALAAQLAGVVRQTGKPPGEVRALCRAPCAAMSRRRGGRPVELRLERFPDGIGVTGLGPAEDRPADPRQRSLGYPGRGRTAR